MLIVNETDILKRFTSKAYSVNVIAGEPILKVTMVYAEPGGTPVSDGSMLLNNLDLKVTSPDGIVYWGNNGLLTSPTSRSGGSPNRVDTVENVFINNPKAGKWKVEVFAESINVDAHLETPQKDADYALVVIGGKE